MPRDASTGIDGIDGTGTATGEEVWTGGGWKGADGGDTSSTGIRCRYPYPIPHPNEPSPPHAELGVKTT